MEFNSLEDYVKFTQGKKVFKKVLIANNGISAVKAIRSVRRWCYEMFGKEREIKFVAMATPDDLRANAEYIRMADEFVEVPGGRNLNNYANVALIVQLAQRYQVDAVWAGWGHASENPALPNTLDTCGITFIGPPGGPMYALGDKIGSTIIAQNAGVPVIAWNATDLKMSYKELGTIPPEIYDQACIHSAEECVKAVEKIGVPVMIKASEGGGGKGIRKVLEASQIATAYRQVQSEVPGSPIFAMKLATQSRHLEVQLLCDCYGQAIALNGRDCSVQRRHQKILEEGPPSAAEPSVWKEMQRAAVRLAKEVSYENAGTVEYLYTEHDKKFCFLELNPRLQVEHPVTEMITGVNLPACQFQVAMGIPLHRIPDIRKFYGEENLFGDSKIDFDNVDPKEPDGHVIAARITAENPQKGFQPTSGKIQELNFRSSRNVWGYFGVDSSGRVHEFADSQIGHIFAWGTSRNEARKNLVIALNDLSIRGDIRTTVEYLKDLLESTDYKNNSIDTAWLDERIKTYKQTVQIDPIQIVLCGIGCEAHLYALNQEQDYLAQLARGQIPNPSFLKQDYKSELIYENVKYQLLATRIGQSSYTVSLQNNPGILVEMEIRSLADGGFLCIMGGKSHVAYMKREVGAKRLVMDGNTCLFVDEYDPTQVRGAMGGKLVRYLVENGAHVVKDQPILEVEVMKMIMPVLAPESGHVSLLKPAGSVMEPGDLICTLLLDDASKVNKSEVFQGTLPDLGEPWPQARGDQPHQILNNAVIVFQNIMDGFAVPTKKREFAVRELKRVLSTPLLPALELSELLGRSKNTMPGPLYEQLVASSNEFKKQVVDLVGENFSFGGSRKTSTSIVNPADQLPHTIFEEQSNEARKSMRLASTFASNVVKQVNDYAEKDKESEAVCMQIKEILSPFADSMQAYALTLISSLIRKYLTVEGRFAELETSDSPIKDDALQELRKEHSANLKRVYELALSHANIKQKNVACLALLELAETCVRREEELAQTEQVDVRTNAVTLLKQVAALNVEATNEVALEARQMLIELQQPSYQESLSKIEQQLIACSNGDKEAVDQLVHSTEAILHRLMDVIAYSKDNKLRATALEIYVRRVYHTYTLKELQTKDTPFGAIAAWHFFSEPNEVIGDSKVSQGLMTGAESFDNLQSLLSSGGASSSNSPAKPKGNPRLPSGEESGAFDLEEPLDIEASQSTDARSEKAESFKKQKSIRPRAGSGWEGEAGMMDETTSVYSADGGYSQKDDHIQNPANEGGKFSGGEGVPSNVLRHALLSYFADFELLKTNFDALLSNLDSATTAGGKEAVNALHIILHDNISSQGSVAQLAEQSLKDKTPYEEQMATKLSTFLGTQKLKLKQAGVRRVTFAVPRSHDARNTVVSGHGSGFFTFRERSGFQEDRLVRHIETPLAFQLDLKRLSNFNISLVPLGKHLSMSHTVHVYQATPKESANNSGKKNTGGGGGDDDEGGASQPSLKKRYFVRALVRQATKMLTAEERVDSYPGPERVLVQALAALEAIQGGASAGSSSSGGAQNHIFLNILGDAPVDPLFVERACRLLARRYAKRLLNARVSEVELKVNARLDEDSPNLPIRLISSNPTGFALRVDSYVEAADPHNPHRTLFYSITAQDSGVSAGLAAMGLDSTLAAQSSMMDNDTHTMDASSATGLGALHGLDTTTPYAASSAYDDRRARALGGGTCFVYDIPALLQKALENEWRSYASKRERGPTPQINQLVKVQELVLDDEMAADAPFSSGLAVTNRAPGSNKIAMVAWHIVMKTPQYSNQGREIILIANDLTVKAGSFGTREDELFLKASEYARVKGIPRLYVAANSGARIGIAEEVKRAFKVKFVDETDPAKGFSYVYLDISEYQMLGPEGRKSVICEPVVDATSNKVLHYKVTAIVGEGRDLGVENLRGSGMIAGETSRAYQETFTATYVAGRTVGIGAYLVRLGQRTIQKGTAAPILLTGYQALNSLMGRAVYSSNAQIGGPAIMYNNGVTHMCVRDDLEGISALVKWLSYVPERRGSSLPITNLMIGDSMDRDVTYMPDKNVISDPRLLITGVETAEQGWLSGIFDKGSFVELLGGWAKTVVTGRARLGKIPVGVIVPENRTVECKKPADPATMDSKETVNQQAGNVWFPDSAFKTATAIRDINNEGLPLVFIANFRGFSGGQRDMFDEILKFGSMIVDALVDFKQPVLVYLPPYSELRGGAWVVIDPTINEQVMEMYADPDARGGVLEPAGTVSIKFRTGDLISAIHRIDPTIQELDGQLAKLEEGNAAKPEDLKKIKSSIEQREKRLLPVYKQIALEIADLHDRPGRMMAKGVISQVIPLKESRRFFCWRLVRLLAERDACNSIVKQVGGKLTMKEAQAELRNIGEVSVTAKGWETDNKSVFEWITSVPATEKINVLKFGLRHDRIAKEVADLGLQDQTAVLKGIMQIVHDLGNQGRSQEQEAFIQTLRRGVLLLGKKASTTL